MTGGTIVSRHFLRRRAREKAKRLNARAKWEAGGGGVPFYRVERAARGPFRWFVVRL